MNCDLRIVFVLFIFLLLIWRVKKGFHNGMIKEVVNMLSAAVSCICIVLIFFMISSVMARTFSVLTICVAGLIGIGILFKLCSLVFKPITAIVNISIVNGLDKLLGAVIGFVEAVAGAWVFYHVLDYMGIYTF